MMRRYVVVERGGTYRIARPGWLFWHWHKEFQPSEYSLVWYTETNIVRAKRQADALNAELDRENNFKRDRWKIV